MPIGSADGTVYDDQLQQTIAEVVPQEVRKVFIFPKKENANIEDRRGDTPLDTTTWPRPDGVLQLPNVFEAAGGLMTGLNPDTDFADVPRPNPLGEAAGLDVLQPTVAQAAEEEVQTQPSPFSNNVDKYINSFFRDDEQRVQLWPEKLARSAVEGLKLFDGKTPTWAVDPNTGEVNTDPHVIENINALAGVVVTGPAPVASKMADGTLGSFAGVKSLRGTNYETTVPFKERLYQAQVLEMGGTHADDIHKSTGFFRGADKQWRYEISDHAAKINEKNLDRIVDATTPTGWTSVPANDKFAIKHDMKLGDILDHPDLYEAYPHLKHIAIKPMPKDSQYLGLANAEGLHLAPLKTDQFKSVLMHEVQHFVQRAEGFARGGSPKEFMPPNIDQAEKAFTMLREAALKKMEGKGHSPDLYYGAIESKLSGAYNRFPQYIQDSVDKLIADAKHNGVYEDLHNIIRSEKAIFKIKDEAFSAYEKLMGEVESRNVEIRLDMTPDQRSKLSPSMTEPFLPGQQIFAPQGGKAEASADKFNMIRDFVDSILGPAKPTVTEIPADALQQYPTQDDAQNALRYGFGYGSGNEPYINAERATLFKEKVRTMGDAFDETKKGNIDLTKLDLLGVRGLVGTTFAQAALSANRNAISGLGFDPHKIALDIGTSAENAAIAGVYRPKADSIYANASPELRSAAVHESTHRGLQAMAKHEGALQLLKELNAWPDDELLVRYIMIKHAGDPEGKIAEHKKEIQQRNEALIKYDNVDDKKRIAKLMDIAADMIKDKRPGGPR